tara:strand:+ start:168 stop:371 length:204 start_codon:yes stop_codon:yes gene_type:complete
MIIKLLTRVNKFLIPPQSVLLGRWNLKHDKEEWNNYLNNYHGDPGYANLDKPQWIEKFEKIEKMIKN